LHHTLNVLAVVVPAWLKAQVPPVWFERYGQRLTEFRLPKDKQEQQALAEVIGADGLHLLEQVYADDAPDWLRLVPAVETLRQVWVQSFYQMEGQVGWREKDNQPPSSQRIASPHDTEARYSTKRNTSWVGYKFHVTETCDDDAPHLITHVETRPGTEHDINALDAIHQALDDQNRLPKAHLVDASYVSADELVRSQTTYGIDLVGPVQADLSWQARLPNGIDSSQFTIDWEQQHATCPHGAISCSWIPRQRPDGYATITIRFRRSDCAACPLCPRCTRNQTKGRTLTVLRQHPFEALQAARQRQQTQTFKDHYASRAGVEGTISHAAFTLDLRRARYRGLAKTHLQHLATAAAINLVRVTNWLSERPRSQTRKSRFALLAA
jgi:transposase